MHYIYIIQNNINLKLYVGQTNNPNRRWSAHKHAALRSKDIKKQNLHLSRSIRKYGEQNFTFTVIENYILQSDANEAEDFWINFFNSKNNEFGYNIANGGMPLNQQQTKPRISSMKGKKHSEESKKLMSDAHKGEKNHFYGKTHSKESKEKISINNGMRGKFGNNHPKFGKTHTNETKLSLSILASKRVGSKNPFSKLTEQQVLEIREQYSKQISIAKLARIYNAGESTIRNIVKRNTWKHI